MRKTFPTLLLSCLLLGLSTVACMPDKADIVVVLPLSENPDADAAHAVMRGIDVAMEHLGESSSMELFVADSKGDPQLAAEHLDAGLAEGGMAAIGGFGVAETEALLRVSEDRNRALLSPAASAAHLSGSSPSLYRIAPSERPSAVALAMTARLLKVRRAAAVIQPSVAGREGVEVFAGSLGEHGGELTGILETEDGEEDIRGFLANQKPHALYLSVSSVLVEDMIRAARNAGYDGPILNAGVLDDPAVKNLGDFADQLYLSRAVFDFAENDEGRFVESYRSRYGAEPDLYAAYGYDAVMTLRRALTDRALLPSELRKGLRDEEIAGVTGLFDFDHRGDVPRYPRVYRVADGELIDFKEEMREREYRRHEKRRELQAQRRRIADQLEEAGG